MADSGIKPEAGVSPGPGASVPVDNAMPDDKHRPAYKRVVWFVWIWLCSVGVLAMVAGLIRWVIKP